jgi:hypothetical protein
MQIPNPFIYDAASTLDDDQVIDFYIDDHNWSRLIQSKRNVFLVGERGSGKSMTLIYNSLKIQLLRAERAGSDASLEYVGILVPCNTPLIYKREFELLEGFRSSVVSEHFLALFIGYQIAEALGAIPGLLEGADEEAFRQELAFALSLEIPSNAPLFRALQLAIDRASLESQRRINEHDSSLFEERSHSFATLVVTLLQSFRRLPALSKTHFLLLIDDAQDLNRHQIRVLNSWLAYRDRSLFSLKVASTKIGRPDRLTTSGGAILEGHDYITIDMERSIHSEESDYGQFAEKIVKRRLERVGILRSPDEFFPIHPDFERDLKAAEERVRTAAQARYPDGDEKKIEDFVYKYRRPEYFRSRSPKANRPSYSGFSTIVYLSTGVIRNLLEPCWWMFDAALSDLPPDERTPGRIQEIPPSIQSRVIQDRSKAAWEQLGALDQTVEGCSSEMANRIYNLFQSLAAYFRDRLLNHKSEPGAISFSISGQNKGLMDELEPLLRIAQRAQLLYVREGPAKADGNREPYYVPNRMLWPIRSLDPHGQHARASIKASALLDASKGIRIPFAKDSAASVMQPELFE